MKYKYTDYSQSHIHENRKDNHEHNNFEIIHHKSLHSKQPKSKTISGERIRKSRLEKSISINSFSKRYNMTRAHISAIELGKHNPSPSTLRKLEDALGKPFWWLGGYDELPERTLGEKIIKCRLMHGYTQKEFANVLNVQEGTLIDWERDKNRPNVLNRKKLKNYLDILIKK